MRRCDVSPYENVLPDSACVVGVNVEKDFRDERVSDCGVNNLVHQLCPNALDKQRKDLAIQGRRVALCLRASSGNLQPDIKMSPTNLEGNFYIFFCQFCKTQQANKFLDG